MKDTRHYFQFTWKCRCAIQLDSEDGQFLGVSMCGKHFNAIGHTLASGLDCATWIRNNLGKPNEKRTHEYWRDVTTLHWRE